MSFIYQESIKTKLSELSQFLLWLWTAVGLVFLFWFSWREPWSMQLLAALDNPGVPSALVWGFLFPVIMIVRGFIMGETLGYIYHRYLQHFGVSTHVSSWVRKNQKLHWEHHMIVYPYGNGFTKNSKYASVESGIASWMYPILIALVFFLVTMGINAGTFLFLGTLLVYYKLVVDVIHSRFHIDNNSWWNNRYFQWIRKIHILHHWEQSKNYTIIAPFTDIFFGTYLSPKKFLQEVEMAPDQIRSSHLINWRLLLLNSPGTSFASEISQIQKYPHLQKDLENACRDTVVWLKKHPEDKQAQQFFVNAHNLLTQIPQSKKKLASLASKL